MRTFDEVQEKISSATTDHELIQTLIDSIGILAKKVDQSINDIGECRHDIGCNMQLLDELEQETSKLKGEVVTYDEV